MGKLFNLASATIFGVLLVIAIEVAAWQVEPPTNHGTGLPDWQSASQAECEILALSLSTLESSKPTDPIPLSGAKSGRGSCAHTFDFDRPVLTYAQLKASAASGHFVEHIVLSRPRYSLLRLRAAVAITDTYGNLGGDGYACWLHWSLRGWAVDGCRRTFVS